MSDYQRIVVVSTQADPRDVARVRADIGSSAVVITAPTADGKRVEIYFDPASFEAVGSDD